MHPITQTWQAMITTHSLVFIHLSEEHSHGR